MTRIAKKRACTSATAINIFPPLSNTLAVTTKREVVFSMKQLLVIIAILLPLVGFSQNSEPLSIAQYRDMYSAAELIESAKACSLDWQPYYEAFLNRQKQLATEQNLPLETRARLELELRNTRERLAKSIPPDCSTKQRDSIAVRLEVELERLIAEEYPADKYLVLKPRGLNWLNISRNRSIPGQNLNDLGDRKITDNVDMMTVKKHHRSGGLTWIDKIKGAELRYSKRWILPSDISSAPDAFLNLRSLIYQDDELSVLAPQFAKEHEIYTEAWDLASTGRIRQAQKMMEDIKEDEFVQNSSEYWLLRAHFEIMRGKKSGAQKYIKNLSAIRGRDTKLELFMRKTLAQLGDTPDFNNDFGNISGMVMEIARGDRIEILALYNDGSLIFALSDGGGINVERYNNESLIWDIQFAAMRIIKHNSYLERYFLSSGYSRKTDFRLPSQGEMNIVLLNGFNQFSRTESIRILEERIEPWFQISGLLENIKQIYQRAEVER